MGRKSAVTHTTKDLVVLAKAVAAGARFSQTHAMQISPESLNFCAAQSDRDLTIPVLQRRKLRQGLCPSTHSYAAGEPKAGESLLIITTPGSSLWIPASPQDTHICLHIDFARLQGLVLPYNTTGEIAQASS